MENWQFPYTSCHWRTMSSWMLAVPSKCFQPDKGTKKDERVPPWIEWSGSWFSSTLTTLCGMHLNEYLRKLPHCSSFMQWLPMSSKERQSRDRWVLSSPGSLKTSEAQLLLNCSQTPLLQLVCPRKFTGPHVGHGIHRMYLLCTWVLPKVNLKVNKRLLLEI